MGAVAAGPDPGDIGADAVEEEAHRQAGLLRARGVQAGHSIGWLALNGLSTLGLLRACEHLGARFVPLNWRLAADELAEIATHAGLQQLLHDGNFAEQVREIAARVRLPLPAGGRHAAGDLMLVYTSGTTGRPKGAIHTAAGMEANARAAIATQGLDARTRALAVLPLFHVGGLCIQVLPTLAAGGRVRLHPRFDPGAWLADVQAWRPTTSLLVPATMRAVVEHPDWARTDLSSLAFLSTGSSVVPPALIEAFHARGVPVAQVYGSTETGPVSIVLPPGEARAHVGKVGHPAPGVRIRLLDDTGADLPADEPAAVGEIAVAGPNVMRGYHRDEAHPSFRDGWFRSGDLARRDAQGRYEVVGRIKDMIISGGENIYPAEIENLLSGLPGLQECAVVGLPDPRWGEVGVLAVVRVSGSSLDEARLRGALEGRIARYKHPKRVVFLDELPKTALGKVQKSALVARLREP